MYFNEQVFASDTILANYPNVLTRSDFSTVVTNTTTGTIYYADTSKGRTYSLPETQPIIGSNLEGSTGELSE